MLTQICKNGCCNIRYCPLTVAFGRTIHSFQGQEAGPGKAIEKLIVNPGSKTFETLNPGTLNCCITRATTLLGANNGKSALYFTGPHIQYERFNDMTHSANGKMYMKVKLRNNWVQYLSRQKDQTNKHMNEIDVLDVAKLEKEIQHRLLIEDLDAIIQYHIKQMTISKTSGNSK